MPFEKGKSGNPKGRAKGAENKVTKAARAMFLDVMEGELEHVQDQLTQLREDNPRDYLRALSQFLPYFIPKMVETEVKIVGPHREPSWFSEVIEREGVDEHKPNPLTND